ncbi:MAG: DUF4340 domain-containing protein [Saprospiraceae bacterium]|nr:DUF4340 domain-containing protein [Saprospiraceae bacterium]
MAKRKNTTLYLLIGFLVIAVAAYFWLDQEDGKTKTEMLKEEMTFKVDGQKVHKIFLAKRSGVTTTLTREGDHWMVDGKYRANQNAVNNLLETIDQVEVQFVPTKEMAPNAIKELATIGIKVEVYDENDQMMKAYYVGGMTNNELGTFFIMENSDKPFVCHLPTMQGGLRARFDLEGEQWRDKGLYSEKPDEIAKVTIEYPQQKSESFVLEKNGAGYKVKPFDPLNKKPEIDADATKVNSFLIGFDKIVAEAFENKNPNRDSILSLVPFATIAIERENGSKKTVSYFPIDKDKIRAGTNERLPVERYYAYEHDGDLFLVQQRNVGKLFWGYSNF